MDPLNLRSNPQGVFRLQPMPNMPEFDCSQPLSSMPSTPTPYQPTLYRLDPNQSVQMPVQRVRDDHIEQEEEKKYAMDISQPGMIGNYMSRKRQLDSIMSRLSGIPDHVKDLLKSTFKPDNFCPTTNLQDVSPLATIPAPKYLDQKYAHAWDQRIVFVDEPHLYFIDGSCKHIISVTTMVSAFFPKFDAEGQSVSTFNGKTFRDTVHRPSHKYHGCKSPEDIRDKWTWWANLGTMFHANVESLFNKEPFEIHPENEEPFRQFKELFSDEDWVDWEPFRTEWSIFDPETLVAGQIDFLGMQNPANGHVVIIDWKRCESIGDCCFNRFRGLPPTIGFGVCSQLENSKWVKYSLQLNFYKYILEKNYGLYVKKMYLVQCHPKLKKKGAAVYKVGNMQRVVEDMMACRKIVLQEQLAKDPR
jgi:hypothetical protein